jgi:hypothetical protein
MQLLRSVIDPTAPRHWRLFRALLLCLLVVACSIRVWLVFQFNPMDHIWSDPGRHWHQGSHPKDLSPMSAFDPVGYQIYIAALVKLTAASPILVGYWTALLSLATPWLWYRFFRELLPDRDWALAGWVLVAAMPSWSAIYSYFMQETLMLPLLGAALWATWRCRRKRDAAGFVLAVGIWLLAGLTRGVCLPLGAVAMTWLWFEQDKKLAKAVVSICLVVFVLGPLAGRSWSLIRQISPHGSGKMAMLYQRAGTQSIEIDFSRSGGTERWQYGFTSPSAYDAPFAPFSDWRPRREWTAKFAIDLDAGSRDWDSAMAGLPPWTLERLAWLTGDNLIRLFFGNSWPDTNRERTIGEINYWSRWIWAPLSLCCLLLILRYRRQQRDWLLPTLILTWFAVQGAFPLAPNEGRYRKPFEGLLLAQCLVLAAAATRRSGRPLLGRPAESITPPLRFSFARRSGSR